VDADRRVELGLGGSTLHRDRNSLNNFTGVGTHHVAANHPVACPVDDELHHRRLVAPAERVLECAEAAAVDRNVTVAFPRFLLGRADTADRRLAENRRRHVLMIGSCRFTAEKRLRKRHRLREGNRREVDAICRVTDRPDTRHTRAGVLIHHHRSSRVQLDANFLEPEIGNQRSAARRIENQIRLDPRPVLESCNQARRRLRDLRRVRFEAQIDPLVQHALRERRTHVVVESSQEQRPAVELHDFDSKAVEDPGKLDRDVATPDDQCAPWQRFQFEDFVRRDRVLDPFDRGQRRPAARRNQDILSTHASTLAPFEFDLDGVGIDDARAAFGPNHARVVEKPGVDAVQAFDLSVLVRTQGRPVEAPLAHRPAEAGCILEILAIMCRVNEQLLRDAAHVHAGTAEVTLLCDCDARTEPRRDPGGANTP